MARSAHLLAELQMVDLIDLEPLTRRSPAVRRPRTIVDMYVAGLRELAAMTPIDVGVDDVLGRLDVLWSAMDNDERATADVVAKADRAKPWRRWHRL